MADSGADYGALLGLLAAAGISTAGSLYANRQNRKLQESANDTAIMLANTAHQREVEDLRAAGLNPILSATGSGAPVPSLGVANQDNVLSSFGSNAHGVAKALSKTASLERLQIAADLAKTDADTESSIATARNLESQNKNLQEQNREIAARIKNIDADTKLKEKQMTSRGVVGQAIEDVKEHGKSTAQPVKSWLERRGAALGRSKSGTMSGTQPINSANVKAVSDRTLSIIEERYWKNPTAANFELWKKAKLLNSKKGR